MLVRAEELSNFRAAAMRVQRRHPYGVVTIKEQTFRTDTPLPGRRGIADPVVQVVIQGPVIGGDELLRHSIITALGDALRQDEAFWWTTANEAQAMLVPVRPGLLPGVVAAVREALTMGFPRLRIRACAQGLMFHGVDRALTPGFLAAIDQLVAGVQSSLRGPLHFPISLSCHGALGVSGPYAGMSSWKVGHASCNNELLFVVDLGAYDEEALRYSVATAVVQPSAVSLVEALSPDGNTYQPAWLIRIPTAGAAAVARWRANGLGLRIHGHRVTARAAPPVRALDSFATIGEESNTHAARVQRHWVGRRTTSIRELFLRISSADDDLYEEETVRRARSNAWNHQGPPGNTLEGRRYLAILPGLRVALNAMILKDEGPTGQQDTRWLASALIRETQGDESDPGSEILSQPSPLGDTNGGWRATYRAGDGAVMRVQAESTIVIRTPTHTGRMFFPQAIWLTVTCPSQERVRMAREDLGDTFEINFESRPPSVLFTSLARDRGPGRQATPAAATAAAAAAAAAAAETATNLAPPSRNSASSEQHNRSEPGPPPEFDGTGRGTAHITGGSNPASAVPIDTPEGWLQEALRATEGEEFQRGADTQTESVVALALLQTYTPRPSVRSVQRLGKWLTEHILLHTRRGNRPRQWMWEYVIFLWALEEGDLHGLSTRQPEAYEDLVAQLRFPQCAREAVPFSRWRQGRSGVKPGHGYTGMNITDEGRAMRILERSPHLSPNVLSALSAYVDFLIGEDRSETQPAQTGGQAECFDLSPRHTPSTPPQPPLPQSSERPPGEQVGTGDTGRDTRTTGHLGPTHSQGRERSRSPPLPPRLGGRLRRHTPVGPGLNEARIGDAHPTVLHQLGATRYGQEGIAGVLALNTGTSGGTLQNTPWRGWGRAMIIGENEIAENACAVSSILQMLAHAFPDKNITPDTAVGLARRIRRWLGLDHRALLPISDSWTRGATRLLQSSLGSPHRVYWWYGWTSRA